MLLFNYHNGFKQEMIATSLMISVAVFGSFLLLAQFTNQKKTPQSSEVLGIQSIELDTSQTPNSTNQPETQLTSQDIAPAQTETFAPSSQNLVNTPASSSATPKPSPTLLELPYGSSEEFETNDFILTFTKPRLLITNSRIFKVDVVLANKAIAAGFENNLYGTITSATDEIISNRVPLNLTEKKKINPGEKLTFSASLSIPETMKLSQIYFDPKDDGNNTNYLLDPTL